MSALWFAAVAVFGGACFWILSERRYRQQLVRLAQRRESPDRLAFVAMLTGTADADVAEWLWDELLAYWRPKATPHPDDDFVEDLPIDPDEANDWLSRFCSAEGLDEKSFSDWPYGEVTTVRNLAAWLNDGRKVQLAAC